MANIPIRDIPGPVQTNPQPGDLFPIDNGTSMQKTTLTAAANVSIPVASSPEAAAGVDDYNRMTALKTKQSIASEVGVTVASKAQGDLAQSAVQPGRQITAGTGLTGGGTLAADRSIALSAATITSLGRADAAVQPTRSITAGTGLVGGGTLAADRSLALSTTALTSLALADTAVQPGRTISAGTGLTGGGDLSDNRTISLNATTIASLGKADTAVQAGRSIFAGDGLTGGGNLAADRTISLSAATLSSLAKAENAVPTTRAVQTSTGLTGGGTLISSLTLSLNAASIASLAKADTAVQPARSVSAGSGLTGGGTLEANRTISLSSTSLASLAKADTAVQPGNAALLPSGGSTGQILAKASGTNYDAAWVSSEAATAVSYGPQTLNNAQKQQALSNIGAGVLAGFRNKIINPLFQVNQRNKTGTVTLSAGEYGHDRFKAGASGCTYTFSISAGVTTLTITAGSLQQVIEGANIESGTYLLSWEGTAQGRIGTAAYGASPRTSSALTGGANVTVEWGTGTLRKPQFTKDFVTEFSARDVVHERLLCQYYYQLNAGGEAAWWYSSTTCTAAISSLTPMRSVSPSVSVLPGGFVLEPGVANRAASIASVALSEGRIDINTAAASAALRMGVVGAYSVAFDAEL